MGRVTTLLALVLAAGEVSRDCRAFARFIVGNRSKRLHGVRRD